MTKGSQNKNSKIAYEHALKSLGQSRKCNGIFHKNYPNSQIDSSYFKRQGDGYQAFCSDCDQARQNIQKTLKRISAIIMANKKYRIHLPEEFKKQEDIINNKIKFIVQNTQNILEIYTRLVEGKEKLNIKELGLYDPELSVEQKKRFIELVNNQVRNPKNDLLIKDKIKEISNKFKFKCSTCNNFFLLLNTTPNISQSRDVFNLNEKPTGYKLPLHNVCLECMKGQRSESLRHYKYLCNGDFVGATRKMTKIGKSSVGDHIHADHIIPLRLGGKHDPINIRPFSEIENIKKRDKLTKEAMDFINDKDYSFKELLTDWYYSDYERVKNTNIKLIEITLRCAVDKKVNEIKNLSFDDKKKQLLELYPTLNTKELNRIIRKCFN
jgi:hypothetical protein